MLNWKRLTFEIEKSKSFGFDWFWKVVWWSVKALNALDPTKRAICEWFGGCWLFFGWPHEHSTQPLKPAHLYHGQKRLSYTLRFSCFLSLQILFFLAFFFLFFSKQHAKGIVSITPKFWIEIKHWFQKKLVS